MSLLPNVYKKRNHLLLIVLTLFLFSFNISFVNAQVPTPKITFISNIVDGDGTYSNPYIINSNIIKVRFDNTSGQGKETALYDTNIHMSGHRSCATQFEYHGLLWSDIKDKIFTWTDAMAGKYYLQLEVSNNNEKNEQKVFFYCRIPPINKFSLPYSPPSSNRKPIPNINVVNVVSGSGTYNDPYSIDSPIIQFYIDGDYDPDGIDDLKYGVFNWAIYTEGHHPKYSGIEGTDDPMLTFMRYDDIKGKIQEWDTRERISENGRYRIVLVVIDQHGEPNDCTVHVTCNTDIDPQPQLMVSPYVLDFSNSESNLSFTVKNIGKSILNWSISETNGTEWIKSVNPSSGNLDENKSVIVNVTIDRSGLDGGTYSKSISIASNGGSQEISLFMQVETSKPSSLWRVNIGGLSYTDIKGNKWLFDKAYRIGSYGYEGGLTHVAHDPIWRTDDDFIYQSQRYKLDAYRFDVVNGKYKVILHFSEIYFKSPGFVSMDVSIENQKVISNLDIFKNGGHDSALKFTFLDIPVSDGRLDITFSATKADAKLSGVEIINMDLVNSSSDDTPPQIPTKPSANK